VSSLNLVRLGALGALIAGVAWTVLGLVDMATLGGRGSDVLNSAFLEVTLYLAALMSTLGGIVGLHARQTPNYGRLGTAGYLATFTGTAILLVSLVLTFLVGGLFGATFLDPVLGAGLWCVLVGFVLLGAATLRLEALPRWCGVVRARVASGKCVGLAPRLALVPGCSGTRSIVPESFSRIAGASRKLSTASSELRVMQLFAWLSCG
jgi:undecaprenyl pyrophosphate phosphatase UppP